MVTLRNASSFPDPPEYEGRSVSMPNITSKKYRRYSIVKGSQTATSAENPIVPPAVEARLFDYFVLIDQDLVNDRPYVKCLFPSNVKHHTKLENLVRSIHDGTSTAMKDSPKNQTFSMILTNHTRRVYCFCRRVLPESFEVCLPLTYCLVTRHNVPKVFYKLLESIEGQHGIGNTSEQLVEKLYKQTIPMPGEILYASARQPSQQLIHMIVRRPRDIRQENTELCHVFRCLGPDGMVQVFETLLLEQSVVLHSQHVLLLTSCIHGLLLMLQPLQWQYILVTVLPNDMQEMLETEPVLPVLAGTLSPLSVEAQKASHICYVQLDKGTVYQKPGTTTKQRVPNLPSAIKKSLVRSLKGTKKFEGADEQAAVRITEIFVEFFAKLFANLNLAEYEHEQFLAQVKEIDRKEFLEYFLKTELFLSLVSLNGIGGR